MTALKFDGGKPPLGLIPRSALVAEANVLAFGAKKYAKHNWRQGMEWSRLVDAALRHITAWNEGEDVDPETGISHLAHARCCLAFLIEYAEQGLGEDDRFKQAPPADADCRSCKYEDVSMRDNPCISCFDFNNHSPKT